MTNENNEPPEQPDPTPQPPPDAPEEPAAPAAAQPPRPRRRLTRSRSDQVISGVAGGLAEYLDVDATLVRIAIVVLTFVSAGTMILVYIGAWIIMPEGDPAAPGEAGGRPPRERGGGGAGIIWGLLLIAAGVLLLLWRLDVALPAWDAVLAGVLIVVGLFLVIEARRGLNGGLLTVAILLTVLLGASAFVNVRVDGGFGESVIVPASAAQLDDEYGYAFGQLELDLRNIEIPQGTTRLSASIMFGQLILRLPDDVQVRIESSTMFGSTSALGTESAGIGARRTFETAGYAEADRRLHIEVSTLFGSTDVRR